MKKKKKKKIKKKMKNVNNNNLAQEISNKVITDLKKEMQGILIK